MVEILRGSPMGQDMLGSVEMMEMTSRFVDVKLAPIYETKISEREEEQKEPAQGPKKNTYRPPRRAFSSIDYPVPSTHSTPTQRPAGSPSLESKATDLDSYLRLLLPTSPIPRTSSTRPQILPPSSSSSKTGSTEVSRPLSPSHAPPKRHPQRPALGSPQRSYSVMDYEPILTKLLPGGRLLLPYLPPEIHYAIFDFLDPIDSTCLGLTSKHFYAIHRSMHGIVPLTARRTGPNDMEWAWRLAGPLIAAGTSKEKAMAMVLPRGQVYCRKCGISRCELHKHIREWFGEDQEYCEVRSKFGPAAPEGTRKTCFRSSPRHPQRCGRHTRQQRAVRLV